MKIKRERTAIQDLYLLVQTAEAASFYDLAAAMTVAFCAMCHFGELYHDGKSPFNQRYEVTEPNIASVSSFTESSYAILHLGRTKADRHGVRDKHHPKLLPISGDYFSPRRWLKLFISTRYPDEREWKPRPDVPLFCDRHRGQFRQAEVLTFVRSKIKISWIFPSSCRQIWYTFVPYQRLQPAIPAEHTHRNN